MEEGYQEVAFFHHPSSGLKAIVAVYSTALGPALGGVRMYPYSSEEEALTDVLRLAKAMAYKAAAAGLDLGGGKAVILGDPARDKSEELLRAFGAFVDGLAGRYITATDVGMTVADMDQIARETSYVVGTSWGAGDPSPATALGVLEGMKVCLEEATGDASLAGRRVAVQGVGKVGGNLVRLLAAEGARIVVADVNPVLAARAAQEWGAEVVEPSRIHAVQADVFSPCAMGGILNPETIPEIKAPVVAGAANNQLLSAEDALLLDKRGILYAPDYVINAGGLIHVAAELGGFDPERAAQAVRRVSSRLREVIRAAREMGLTTAEAADRLAEERMRRIGGLRAIGRGIRRRQGG